MLCYLDRTFCPFYNECKHGDVCPRALTEDVEERAMKMNLPIAKLMDKPDLCFIQNDNWKKERKNNGV